MPAGSAAQSEMVLPQSQHSSTDATAWLSLACPHPSFHQWVHPSFHQWVAIPRPHMNSWVLRSNLAWSALFPGSCSDQCMLWTGPSWPASRSSSHMHQHVLQPILAWPASTPVLALSRRSCSLAGEFPPSPGSHVCWRVSQLKLA